MTLEEQIKLYKLASWNYFVDKVDENPSLKGLFRKLDSIEELEKET